MKKMSIFAMLLAAVLVTSYSVSGTYAKYTSTFEGASSTAKVAKWGFEINEEEASATTEFEFNLFDTVKDTAGADEEDVKSGNIIAPGTSGEFDIKLANLSEVNANYAINYTVTNDGKIPVEFSVDGQNWTTSLANVAASDATKLAMGADTTITVQWRWAFNGADSANYNDGENKQTDVTDTTLGNAGSATITVKADITVTQID